MLVKVPITEKNCIGYCSALKHSGSWIFCCCDNTPGWASQSGTVSECPFLKVFASSLLACVCKPVDPSRLQNSHIQSGRKTEFWFVMSTLQSRSRGLKEKQHCGVFVELTLRVHFELQVDLQLHPPLPQAWKQTLSSVCVPKHLMIQLHTFSENDRGGLAWKKIRCGLLPRLLLLLWLPSSAGETVTVKVSDRFSSSCWDALYWSMLVEPGRFKVQMCLTVRRDDLRKNLDFI